MKRRMFRINLLFFIIICFVSFSNLHGFDSNDDLNIDFLNTKWTFQNDSEEYKSELKNNSLLVTARELKRAYIRTGSGKFNSVPLDDESIDFDINSKYIITINCKKDNDIKIMLWVIMYDNLERIGHVNGFLGGGEHILFEPLKNSEKYKIILEISGDGIAEIENISIKKINTNQILNLMNNEGNGLDNSYIILSNLMDSEFDIERINHLLKYPVEDVSINNILKRFFNIENKEIIDTGITDVDIFHNYLKDNDVDAVEVTIDNQTILLKEYPINWSLDPNLDRSWQWYFQYLEWVHRNYINDSRVNLNIAGYIISDWVNSQMLNEYPEDFTFEDHSLARRFEILYLFIEKYIENNDILDKNILRNSMIALITHVYALSSEYYYPSRIPYNHGLYMDLFLYKYISFFTQLVDVEIIENIAKKRLLIQYKESYSTSRVLFENSPAYHFFITDSIQNTLDIYKEKKEKIPEQLYELYNTALYNMIFFVQPNNSYVQFGDTTNEISGALINNILNSPYIDKDTIEYKNIQYCFNQGEIGEKPKELDKIFSDAGYATFRNSWSFKNYINNITSHFTCSNFVKTHYHEDEFSFSLYGYGSEIIVDSGFYNHNYDDIFNKYRYSAYGHNVLLVDDEHYSSKDEDILIDGSSMILNSHIDEVYSWLKATHNHYRNLGIEEQYRYFVHYKPDTFIVIDEILSNESHKLNQQFHFHPDYDEFNEISKGKYLVTSSKGNMAKLLIQTSIIPSNVLTYHGFVSDEDVKGWYFPETNQKYPCLLLSFEYEESKNHTLLPILFKVIPPGEDIPDVNNFGFSDVDRVIHWVDDDTIISLELN